MSEEIAGTIKLYSELVCVRNLPESIAMEIIKAAELKCIASALERIAANTDSMEQSLELISDVLADCQVKTRHSSAIAITGMIETT